MLFEPTENIFKVLMTMLNTTFADLQPGPMVDALVGHAHGHAHGVRMDMPMVMPMDMPMVMPMVQGHANGHDIPIRHALSHGFYTYIYIPYIYIYGRQSTLVFKWGATTHVRLYWLVPQWHLLVSR